METLLQSVVWLLILVGGLKALPTSKCVCDDKSQVNGWTTAMVFGYYAASLWVMVDAAISVLKWLSW